MSPDRLTQVAAVRDGIYQRIVDATPKLQRGRVWCVRCQRAVAIDPIEALRHGWPSCCGQSMTLDSPEERGAAPTAPGATL